ncbi:hypothetical protein [Bacillus thuringiensis]|nr:hypothetical protein [Bacillus thuringiensis]
MGRSSQREREEKFERHRQLIGKITSICNAGTAYSLYEKLDELAK